MGYFKISMVLLRSLLAVMISTPIQAYANGMDSLSVSLKVTHSVVKSGELPKLELKIENISDKEVRILNISGRVDLQDTYCEAIFLKDGNSFNYNVAISDPGSVRDQDFVILSSGKELVIDLAKPNIDPASLLPGKYGVYVVYRPNPEKYSDAYRTQVVDFVVTKK